MLLIGLAAKNSILIVEFAEQLRERGLSIVDAAVEASRIRLRPILMTSFAFILGVLPLAFATGAGAGARNSVGTSVAGGMLASTLLSVFFIPVLYVVIRSLAPGRYAGPRPTTPRPLPARWLPMSRAGGLAHRFSRARRGASRRPGRAGPCDAAARAGDVRGGRGARDRDAVPASRKPRRRSCARRRCSTGRARCSRPLVYGNVGTSVLDAARGFDDDIVTPRTQTALQRDGLLRAARRRALGQQERRRATAS